MRHGTPSRIASQAGIAASIAAAALAFSCAAPLRVSGSLDPLCLISGDRLAYARVSGTVARDLAPSLMSAPDIASAKGLLARTRIVALGLGQSGGDARGSLQAVLIGDYPFRAASISLGSSREWRREKSSFYNSRLGLRAAVPGPSIVVASAGPIEGLLEAAASAQSSGPPPSPIPYRLSELASAELVLWVPSPFKSLAVALADESMDVPALGLLITASPNAASGGGYSATVAFLMDGPESVKIYKPLLKLAWYAIESGLLGDGTGGSPRATFAAKGDIFVAEGVALTRSEIVHAVRLAAGGSLGGLDRGVGAGR